MGIFRLLSDSRGDDWTPTAPDPNPFKFKVLKQENVGKRSILLVEYEGCTTFGGRKLLLTRRKWTGGSQLDPHLLGDDHIVMARFEPTDEGLEFARMCARVSPTKKGGA
jgi:hypothetical protein